MRTLLLSLALLIPAQVEVPEPGVPEELKAELEAMVDLETPEQRVKAAIALARDRRFEIDDLVAGMRAFGSFAPLESGFSSRRVKLRVGDAHEETDLHLYVPARYDPEVPAPLMLSFHGTGGEGRQAVPMWRGVAEELGMIVLAPSEAGANGGYAFSQRERDAALAAMRWIRRQVNIDEDRIFLTGVSRGGHLAWDLALRHPDRFAAAAPMIGGPWMSVPGENNNMRYSDNVLHLPIRDLQGARDDPGLIFNLQRLFERLDAADAADVELLLFDSLGHSFDFSAVDWVSFLSEARRIPYPERAIRATADTDEARAFFVEVLELGRGIKDEFKPKVDAKRWNRLDKDGKKVLLQELADDHTARIEVQRTGPREFEVDMSGVRKFRLLIPASEFDASKPLSVRRRGKTLNRRAKASKRLLCEDFAERFDRRFLPVAALELR